MMTAAAVDNRPFPTDQLDGLLAPVLDADMIGPEPSALAGFRLLGKEADRYADRDVARRRAVGEKALHASTLPSSGHGSQRVTQRSRSCRRSRAARKSALRSSSRSRARTWPVRRKPGIGRAPCRARVGTYV